MHSDEGGAVAVNWMRLLEHFGQDFVWLALTGSCLISSIISDPLFLFSSGPRRLFERSRGAVRRSISCPGRAPPRSHSRPPPGGGCEPAGARPGWAALNQNRRNVNVAAS